MKIIKLFIPKKIRYLISATKEFLYDIKSYVIHSNTYYFLNTQNKFDAYLTLQYHVVEKGLTMPNTRPGFGIKVVTELIELCKVYIDRKLNPDSLPYKHSIEVLKEYLAYHKTIDFKLDTKLSEEIIKVTSGSKEILQSNQHVFSRQDFYKDKEASFELFCKSRHSSRNFIRKEIPTSIIMKCIELANHSPSACNRQPTRVYIVNNYNTLSEVLKLQSGNRGFGDLTQTLLVITSDLSAFQSIKERNEPALNAGLFSMTLAYALHYHEIGSCMLNWSSSIEKDLLLRKLLNIPNNEKVLMLIACGYLPESFKIADSPRLSAEEITKIIE